MDPATVDIQGWRRGQLPRSLPLGPEPELELTRSIVDLYAGLSTVEDIRSQVGSEGDIHHAGEKLGLPRPDSTKCVSPALPVVDAR